MNVDIMDFSAKFSFFPKAGYLRFVHSDVMDKSCAFTLKDEIKLVLSVSRRSYLKNVTLSLFSQDGKTELLTAGFAYTASVGAFDEYELSLPAEKLGVGLYFARICIESFTKVLYGYQGEDEIVFVDGNDRAADIQLSVSDFHYDKPSDFYGGIIYQIFVDRFNRSGKTNVRDGAVLVDDWSCGVPEFPDYPGAPLKNNTFYGGTLDGITDKLDYIQSLGANIIYLSPIFESVSNHRYDTADYMRVDSLLGGDKALKRLICECKKRGVKLILDGVFNHTGADSVYFNRYSRYPNVGAYQSKDSDYYGWYNFTEYPNKYDAWWGIEILPRLNLSAPSCRNFFLGKDGVVEKYVNMGIDGLRLDVADELSDDFIAEIKNILNKNKSSILYGEVWEDASNKIAYDKRKEYYLGLELDGVMNYPLRTGLLDYVMKSDTQKLRYAVSDIIRNAPKRVTDAQMNLIGSHDTERILTAIGASSSEGIPNSVLREKRMTVKERERAEKILKALWCILSTLPGIPTIFYGDEAGLEGYSDPFNRMPYPWGNESEDLLSHYRTIGDIRRKNSVYTVGGFELLHLSKSAFAFKRFIGRKALVTVFNNSQEDITVEFSSAVKDLLSGNKSTRHILKSKCASIYK